MEVIDENKLLKSKIKQLEFENIAFKKTETLYQEDKNKLSYIVNLIDNMQDIIFSIDMQFNLTSFNKMFEQTSLMMEGITLKLGDNIFEKIPSFKSKLALNENIKKATKGDFFSFEDETEINGNMLVLAVKIIPLINEKKEQIGILVHSKNITERKKTETELQEKNRKFKLLSLVDEAILNTNLELDLNQHICEILANFGAYHLVWIGYSPTETNNRQLVVSVASEGIAKQYLNEIEIDLQDEKLNNGPTGKAMLSGQIFAFNNIEFSTNYKPWRAAAQNYGFESVASFPLIIDKKTFASINFYSSKKNTFTNEETELLKRICNNLSFAIQSIRNKEAKIAAEANLIKSNQRFEYVTKATFDAIWDWDILNNTHYWGEGFETIFGYKPGTFLRNKFKWEDNVHPADLNRISTSLTECINNPEKTNWNATYRFKKANNDYAYVTDKAVILKNKKGESTRLIGALQDITHHREEEQKLKLYASVITNANDGVIISKINKEQILETEIVYVNEAYCKMTGYSKEELIGETPQILVGKKTDKAMLEALKKAMENSLLCNIEMLNYKKNTTEFWVDCSMVPVTNEKEEFTYWISIQRDITEKKREEEDRIKLIQELTQNNKDLKQFSYITSHNLRSPLSNLIAIGSLIDTSTIDNSETIELIEGFKTSTNQLNETLNDLIKILIIKENTSKEVEELDLKNLFNEVTNSIASIINKANAGFQIDFKEAEKVFFNKAYLESILLNLITNSIKYAHPDRDPKIKISTQHKKNHIQLSVEDNGLGFNEERAKGKIFGLYQKFHNHPDSKGIGLYLVQSQLTALGGSISVSSKENIGTKFIITFAKKYKK